MSSSPNHDAQTPAPPGSDADPARAAALAFRGPLLRVLGGPGTGKTTLAADLVADRLGRGELAAEQTLILAPTRRGAARLRERVTRVAAATASAPLARTPASLAFGLLRSAAIREALPTPYLLSGPEQDLILRDLLAGHRAEPEAAPVWPAEFAEALTTAGFRGELRDLLMRAVEHGLDADGLARVGGAQGRPEWVAAAAVLAEYDEVTALSRPGGYDPAWLLTVACDLVEDDPEVRADLAALRLVVVDDAQELTAGGARLLGLLTGTGAAVVLLGDPDAAVQPFRGADPRFLATDWAALTAPGPARGARAEDVPPTIVLATSHRLRGEIARAHAKVATLVGALGGGAQRRWRPAADPPERHAGDAAVGALEVHVFRSAAQEAAHVADELRRAHLLRGVPWGAMAVIVRGRSRADVIRRVLAAQHVPVAESESDLPVRDEDAVRPLLQLLDAALQRVAARADAAPGDLDEDPDAGWRLDPIVAIDLLTSPYGGADAVALRRLRRALRAPALAAGQRDTPDELLARAVARPGELLDLGPEAAGARRIARMLAVATALLDRAEPSAEEVVWALWEAAEVAQVWRDAALAGGRSGARADRDLDAVIVLLDAAAAFADRLPGIGPDAFLAHIAGQDVAADRIVARATTGDRVEVLTPHAAAGREFDVVLVAGVQEGVWPDTRLRGSVLGSADLVDVLAGRDRSLRAAQTAIRHDEARLLHVATSRARDRLHVSAVRDEGEHPSPYLDVLDPLPDGVDRPFTEVDRPLDLVGAVARLRRDLVREVSDADLTGAEAGASGNASGGAQGGSAGAGPGPDPRDSRGDSPPIAATAPPGAQTAGLLAALAGAGIRGADPEGWWALRRPTDDRPRLPGEALVRVSPSTLLGLGQCQLRHVLTSLGGEGPAVGSAALGTLIHEVIADCGDAPQARLSAALDRSWARLGLRAGWLERKQRGDAEAMLAHAAAYFEHAATEGWRRVAAEQAMRLVVGRALITGVVDRLEEDGDGHLRVIDFKTGSSKPKRDEIARHPQLGAYQLALRDGALGAPDAAGSPAEDAPRTGRALGEGAGAALVQLGRARTTRVAGSIQAQSPLAADEEPSWADDLVADSARVLAGARYQATVGDWCRTCAVRSSCPAQPEGGMLA